MFKLLLFYALYYFPMNSTVPALIHRLHRCEPEDDAAIRSLLDVLFGADGFWTSLHYSLVLQFHVMFSEMWESDEFADVDLNDYFNDLSRTVRVGRNQGLSRWSLRRRWPLYVDERWDDAWAETEIPMLMLQGMLDPATPYVRAQRAGEHFDGAHQHFIAFPEASHSVLSGTPVSDDPAELHCATLLLLDFLSDPEGDLDTSCVDDVYPIDFRGTAEIARTYFDTDDLWE